MKTPNRSDHNALQERYAFQKDHVSQETHDLQDTLAHRLSKAIQIPTIVVDDMGHVGEDERWDIFYAFAVYLQRTFPLVHTNLSVTTVSEHGLLYTWQGVETELKPLLLMAHSDVVPVASSSIDQWTHPPFSGHYDGEFVWGRGSEDDKSNLIAMLSAIETLLSQDFWPRRTVVLAVGFDEEGGAERSFGARCLAEELERRYGTDGIALICKFDEGIGGVVECFGTEFALPATAEKGYVDINISVEMPGGNSSYPPDHTAIGFLSQAIVLIESNLFPLVLSEGNPFLEYLRRAAEHAKDIPDSLRSIILDPNRKKELTEYLARSIDTCALIQTTTAVTLVQGGDKVNSLPEHASAKINHRIATHSSVAAVKLHYKKILETWAIERELDLWLFGEEVVRCSKPTGAVKATSEYDLDPSPVSSTTDPRFAWLSEALEVVFGKEVVVAPTLLSGNTDTRYYWGLSSQIYRMSPWRQSHDPRGTRLHAVDERMPVRGLVEMWRFYRELILSFDRNE